MEVGAHRGHTEIRAAVEGYVRRMESAELRLLNIAVNGNVVLTERIDEIGLWRQQNLSPLYGCLRGKRRQDHRLARLLRRSVMKIVIPVVMADGDVVEFRHG
jgi:hypothetical protein